MDKNPVSTITNMKTMCPTFSITIPHYDIPDLLMSCRFLHWNRFANMAKRYSRRLSISVPLKWYTNDKNLLINLDKPV